MYTVAQRKPAQTSPTKIPPRKPASLAVPNPTKMSIWTNTLPIQAGLMINTLGDKYEQEADQVAEQVMRTPETAVQRKTCACGKPMGPDGMCEDCKRKQLGIQRIGASDGGGTAAPPIVNQVLSQQGRPLDHATRNFMEARFGHDFGDVRTHTGAKAAISASAINSVAYTAGTNIVFGAGKSPGKDVLTAHELIHILQQRGDTKLTEAGALPIPTNVQRQCQGDIGNPSGYASRAASAALRCNQANTGIPDPELTARITNGRRIARIMIDDALTLLNRMLNNTASEEALSLFRRLFRPGANGPSPGQIRQAIGIYTQICSWLTSPTARRGGGILCLSQNTGNCNSEGGGLASAACLSGQTTRQPVNLCPNGISPNARDTAETIIHEAAHRFGICTRPPAHAPAGTSPPDERYLHPDGGWYTAGNPSQRLPAPTSPALATSADSYSAFAREAIRIMGSERLRERDHGERERPITGFPNIPTVLE